MNQVVLLRAGPHGQGGVQQEDPLVCPGLQVAVCRSVPTKIRFQHRMDVPERGRLLDADWDREGQPMRLARVRVGVLSEDHDLDVVEGGQLECPEGLRRRRVDLVLAPLIAHELEELRPVLLLELPCEAITPVIREEWFAALESPDFGFLQASLLGPGRGGPGHVDLSLRGDHKRPGAYEYLIGTVRVVMPNDPKSLERVRCRRDCHVGHCLIAKVGIRFRHGFDAS